MAFAAFPFRGQVFVSVKNCGKFNFYSTRGKVSLLCAGNVSPDSGRSWGAPSQSSRCAGAAAAGTGRSVSAAPGPARAAPLPSPARAPPGTPAPRAPRPAQCPGSSSGPTEAVRRRDAQTRRALTSFSATSRISTCNNKAGTAEPRAPGRGPAAAAALPHARGRPPRAPARPARDARRLPEPPADRVHLPGTGR